MYLMYLDESGDTGVVNSPTRYFILSAIVIHETDWRETLDNLVTFRKKLRDSKGLKLRDEIHCTDFINRPGELKRIKRNDRLDIIKKCMDWLNSQSQIKTFSVVVDKADKSELVFERAWKTILLQFENAIKYKKLIGPLNLEDKGIVLSDNTDVEKLTKLMRQIRHHKNDKNLRLTNVIEDPVFRNSKNSLLHQMNDVIAYCLRQRYEANNYMRRKGGHNFYYRIPNIVLRDNSNENSWGIIDI